ncbi:AaceriABL153Wp [[Ashbya] aceris (nom. inval.)]|nr:AaceriABL153Wp [[Ashbya] aceris (nom. inval.)]
MHNGFAGTFGNFQREPQRRPYASGNSGSEDGQLQQGAEAAHRGETAHFQRDATAYRPVFNAAPPATTLGGYGGAGGLRSQSADRIPQAATSSDVFGAHGAQVYSNVAPYNDDEFYEDVGRVSYLHESSTDGNHYYEHKESVPMLEEKGAPYTLSAAEDSLQSTHGLHLADSENQEGYIDQRGDEYQIISYLDSQGDTVNPYGSGHIMSARTDVDPVYRGVDTAEGYFSASGSDLSRSGLAGSTPVPKGSGEHTDLSAERLPGVVPASKHPKHRIVLRKFKLYRGNFIFDCPVSEQLVSQYARGMRDDYLTNEYKFMRYQAVTCEPAEFQQKNFTLRQLKYAVPRRTEIMIVITMYNEDDLLLARTLKGVMDNIKYFTRRKRSDIWGPDAWKRICVCIVSDGREAISPRALALLSALGCYQDGFAKDEINGKKVVAHVYEHTTKINITKVSRSKVHLACGDNTVPVQLLFCLKEKNQKKINSHRWAFEALAPVLQPEIVTLLDAGTLPGKDSIYQLWKEFLDPNIGGACGEIRTDLGPRYTKLFNPLVASQNFEYKMSNILDKTTESNFGFISVLPGAFSAYRYTALEGEPLRKYFMGENLNTTVFLSNMYLAEDRILCFEIVIKKDARWLLRYCRASYAATDVPDRIPEFILQRRRWLNGSFFAALYSFVHFYKIWSSGHTILRKILLTIEFFYLFLTMLIAWFSLSSFFLVFRILTLSLTISYPEYSAFRYLSVIFLWLYGITVLITFILSLGNKPKGTPRFYLTTFIFFAILMIYMMFCALYMSVTAIQTMIKENQVSFRALLTSGTFKDIVISMSSTYCLYILSSVVYMHPMHMLTSFIQYVLLSPSYINILNIYAFCNVHDISWGTKGAQPKPLGKLESKADGTVRMEIPVSAKEIDYNYTKYLDILHHPDKGVEDAVPSFEEQKTSYLAAVRSLVIIFWIISNFIIIAVVLETGGIGQYQYLKAADEDEPDTIAILSNNATVYFSVILWLVAFMAAVRFVGCCIYMIKRVSRRLRRS